MWSVCTVLYLILVQFPWTIATQQFPPQIISTWEISPGQYLSMTAHDSFKFSGEEVFWGIIVMGGNCLVEIVWEEIVLGNCPSESCLGGNYLVMLYTLHLYHKDLWPFALFMHFNTVDVLILLFTGDIHIHFRWLARWGRNWAWQLWIGEQNVSCKEWHIHGSEGRSCQILLCSMYKPTFYFSKAIFLAQSIPHSIPYILMKHWPTWPSTFSCWALFYYWG